MGSTNMVEFAPQTRTSRTGEPRQYANTGECLGFGWEVREGGRQRNRAVESSHLKEWLPVLDMFRTVSLQTQALVARDFPATEVPQPVLRVPHPAAQQQASSFPLPPMGTGERVSVPPRNLRRPAAIVGGCLQVPAHQRPIQRGQEGESEDLRRLVLHAGTMVRNSGSCLNPAVHPSPHQLNDPSISC